MMGLAKGATIIRGGDNLAVAGLRPSGIAAQGQVVWRAQLSAVVSYAGASNLAFSGWIGCGFVPNRAITVTAVGRWVFPQDTDQTSSMALLGADGSVLGATTFDNISLGQFNYGNLPSPVSLSAGAPCYAMAQAIQFYDNSIGSGSSMEISPDFDSVAGFWLSGVPGGVPNSAGDYPVGPTNLLYLP